MTLKKFVRIHITASHDEELPIDFYTDEDGEMTLEEIRDWADENSAEILLEDDWASWDVDVLIFEREVPEDEDDPGAN